MRAISSHAAGAIAVLLDERYLNQEMLEAQDADGKTALDLAKTCGVSLRRQLEDAARRAEMTNTNVVPLQFSLT